MVISVSSFADGATVRVQSSIADIDVLPIPETATEKGAMRRLRRLCKKHGLLIPPRGSDCSCVRRDGEVLIACLRQGPEVGERRAVLEKIPSSIF